MSRPGELAVASVLIRFLLNRLDEDQAAIDKTVRAETRGAAGGEPAPTGLRSTDRLRVEVLAKRQVIGGLQQLFVLRDLPGEQRLRDVALSALSSMASPYRAHPQFRSEWDDLSDVADPGTTSVEQPA